VKYIYAMSIMTSGVMFFSSKEKLLKYANESLSNAHGGKIKTFNALTAFDGWAKRIKLDGGDVGIDVDVVIR